jgi:hypothetical protein
MEAKGGRRLQAAALQGAFGTVIFLAEASVSPSAAGPGDPQTPLRLLFPEMGCNGKPSPFGRSQTPQNGVCADRPSGYARHQKGGTKPSQIFTGIQG